MKSIFFLMTMIAAIGVHASDSLVCGTENQWSEGARSGWYLKIDLKSNRAMVVKSEDAQTVRSYGHDVTNLYNTELTLTSEYGDKIELLASADNKYSAHYENADQKEEFSVTCFDGLGFSSVNADSLKLPKNLSLSLKMKKAVKEKNDLVYKVTGEVELPFNFMAQELKYAISDIGDWEETVLTADQTQKVLTALETNAEFRKLNLDISNDLKKDSKLKKLGLLFARDWYSSEGNIGFVFEYEKQLFVLPFSFPGDVVFGDARLDYVY